MNRLRMIFLVICLLVFNLAGCAKTTEGQDLVAPTDPAVEHNEISSPSKIEEEIELYVNEELPIFWYLEEAALFPFEDAIGMGYESEAQVYTVLTKTVMPAYKDFIDYLKELELTAPELIEIHQTYIDAASIQYTALKAIQNSLEAGEPDYVEKASDGINAAAEGFNAWQTAVYDIAAKYQIEIKNPYETDVEYAEDGDLIDPLLEEFLKDLLDIDVDETGGRGNSGPSVAP